MRRLLPDAADVLLVLGLTVTTAGVALYDYRIALILGGLLLAALPVVVKRRN